jgi:5'-3' exonuclease
VLPLLRRAAETLCNLNKSGSLSLQTADGIPTTVSFGFLRSLLALLEQERPDAVVVVFDAPGGNSFR